MKRFQITFKGKITLDASSKIKAYAKALDTLAKMKDKDTLIVGTEEIKIKELPF